MQELPAWDNIMQVESWLGDESELNELTKLYLCSYEIGVLGKIFPDRIIFNLTEINTSNHPNWKTSDYPNWDQPFVVACWLVKKVKKVQDIQITAKDLFRACQNKKKWADDLIIYHYIKDECIKNYKIFQKIQGQSGDIPNNLLEPSKIVQCCIDYKVFILKNIEHYCNKNYYELLEIPFESDEGTIKRAYRKLSKQYHPDKPKGDESTFKKIKDASAFLLDKNNREMYIRMVPICKSYAK
jgi:hypothetical protein